MPQRKLLIILAFIAYTSLGLPDGLLGVSWPSIRGEFAIPIDSLGLLVLITTAGYLCASFYSGVLLRLMPIGSLLSLATFAAAFALLGFAMAPSWHWVLGLGFIAGLGGGAIDAGLNTYGAEHFSPRLLNWLHAFFGLGTTLGPLIVTAVLGSEQIWRLSYWIVGSAQMILAFTFFTTRKRWDTLPSNDDSKKEEVLPAPMRTTLRRPVVWFGMMLFFCYCGVEIATAQWSYSLLTLGRGFSETTAGLVVSLYWGSLLVGRILFGFFANQVPLIATLRLCIVCSITGATLFWLNLNAVFSVIGLMLMGFFFAPLFASLISITPERVGREHASSTIGFQVASAALGAAAVTTGVGILARNIGLEAIAVAILVNAVLLLLFYEAFCRARTRDLKSSLSDY